MSPAMDVAPRFLPCSLGSTRLPGSPLPGKPSRGCGAPRVGANRRALTEANCKSAQSASAVLVLKRLGGFTAVLTAALDERLAQLEGNPRAQHRLEAIARSLHEQIPEMRKRVQATLARTSMVPGAGRDTGEGHARSPLGDGSYPEVDLRSPQLHWAGRADLLTIRGNDIQITDYKTGDPDPHHAEQLRLYALLWAHDTERNPSGQLVSSLVLSYPNEDVRVPAPSNDELAELETVLAGRLSVARKTLSHRPPPARPAPDLCTHCPVRHMCEEYWQFIEAPALEPGMTALLDFQVTVRERNGPRSWTCQIARPSGMKDTRVLLRVPEEVQLAPGQAIRVLTAIAEADEDHELLTLTVTSMSEVFSLRPR